MIMNTQLESLTRSLKRLSIEKDCRLWKRIATDLEKPSRIRRMVNIYKIDAHAKEGETIIVPGKVCGDGELTKNVTVAAYQFSDSAKKKIEQKGKAITIVELMQQNPQGAKVRILG